MLIDCIECGNKISDKAALCINCGAEVCISSKKLECKDCGIENDYESGVCGNCGCPLALEKKYNKEIKIWIKKLLKGTLGWLFLTILAFATYIVVDFLGVGSGARGYKQWHTADRYVERGDLCLARTFYGIAEREFKKSESTTAEASLMNAKWLGVSVLIAEQDLKCGTTSTSQW